MAKIVKRLSMQVGSWVDGEGKTHPEYRDIGVMLEFEDRRGNTWNEVKLHMDVLQPTLALMVRSQSDRGASNARVKLFDVARKVKDKSVPDEGEKPEGHEEGEGGGPFDEAAPGD
jgi:hypothetical protein